MNHAAQRDETTVITVTKPVMPSPAQLPGIAGFYVLTAEGEVGRYQADGRLSKEPELTRSLAGKLKVVLDRYRAGKVDDLVIGLVTPNTPERPWKSASLVFSDNALREVLPTSSEPAAPLTSFQRRNKIKSVFRGMELVLDTKKASQPHLPRFCPVLFAPEVNGETLRRRYDVGALDTRHSLEVLDLMGPFPAPEQKDPALIRMVVEMTKAKIAPELRSAPNLKVVGQPEASSYGAAPQRSGQENPWQDTPEGQSAACFNDGDPVPYWLLAWFSPFNELNDLQRQFLARGHVVTRRRAGSTLIERGSREDVTIYLIEGTLELEAFDGKKISVAGGTRRAHLPISLLRPHAYTVRAATDVSVIVVSQSMVREITRITTTYRSRSGIQVTEVQPLPQPESDPFPYEPGSRNAQSTDPV